MKYKKDAFELVAEFVPESDTWSDLDEDYTNEDIEDSGYVFINHCLYKLKKIECNGPDLTCFVCGKDLLSPIKIGAPWTCPDPDCDSHFGEIR